MRSLDAHSVGSPHVAISEVTLTEALTGHAAADVQRPSQLEAPRQSRFLTVQILLIRLGYCPLNQQGQRRGLCNLLEGSGNDLMIMAELEPSPTMPLPPLEAAHINKAAMQKLGGFRA